MFFYRIFIKIFFRNVIIYFFEDILTREERVQTNNLSERQAIILQNIFEKEFNRSSYHIKQIGGCDENNDFKAYFVIGTEEIEYVKDRIRKLGFCILKK